MSNVEMEAIDSWVDGVDRGRNLTDQMQWHLMRNRPLTLREKALVREFYSDQFQSGWQYNTRHPWHDVIARFRVDLTQTVFPDLGKVLDGGCASGEEVAAFRAEGVDCWGFDLCPDLHDTSYEEARPFLRMGPFEAIPFSKTDGFKTFISYDVFEHVPIDKLESLPAELVRLGITQIACVISSDTLGAGHITIKDLPYYEALFAAHGFRLMRELTPHLNEILTPAGYDPDAEKVIWVEYYRCGDPRNGWNAVPGHLFFVRG